MDTSGSIAKDDFVKQKEFVNRLVASFGFESQKYGIILFSYVAEMPIKFTDYNRLDAFKAAVLKLPQAGSITRIDRGLLLAQKKLFTKEGGNRPEANRVLFLLTDGSQTYSDDVVDNALISKNIRYSGTEFLVLGIGRGVDRDELNKIAGGKETVYVVDSFEKLKSQEFVNSFNISCSKSLLFILFFFNQSQVIYISPKYMIEFLNSTFCTEFILFYNGNLLEKNIIIIIKFST